MKRLIVGVFILAVGCASVNKNLVLTEDAVHDALHNVDLNVRTFCTAHEEFKAQCADVRPPMLAAVNAGTAFNRAVRDQKVAALVPVITTIGDLVKALKALPEGQTAAWIRELGQAIAAAYAQTPAPPVIEVKAANKVG